MQRSFDDLGTPLSQVTFVVLDLETTGGSPTTSSITEVGGVKLRGGECLGTFQTLVNPGTGIPPRIVYLTGITEAMVAPAPPIDSVLPAFAEFIGEAVVVGHNVRFDLGFLRANLARLGYPPMRNRSVDTCALARRLVRDEVPDCRLSTLARHFRTAADPCHRALDDARATAEVLHCLLERAAGMGVVALDDLLALPTTAAHPQAAKLRWVAGLPRRPGVYLFRDGAGRVLYVGRATDLRRRVRSYFAGDERRKVGGLLREAQSLDHVVCAHDLEASVAEVRLIHEHMPRYNRQARGWRRYRYLKLTLDERFPRLSVVGEVRRGDGCLYVGPAPSAGAARAAADALESVVPLRRCTARPGRQLRPGPCTPAQLGVATCPCAGQVGEDDYARLVERAVAALTGDPASVLEPLAARMRRLAGDQRFEEAAAVRDRAAALSRLLARHRRLDQLVRAGRVEIDLAGGGGAVVDHGRLVAAWGPGQPPLPCPLPLPVPALPLAREAVDETACIAAWIQARATRIRLRFVSHGLASALPRLPDFEAPAASGRGARAVA